MKEVLFVTHKYPPVIGGMEKQSYELIKGMEEHYKVYVIAYTPEDGNKGKWFATLKSRIKKTLADHPGISLIHLNDGLMGCACLWLQKHTDIPVIVTYHGLDVTFPSVIFQKHLITRLKKFDGAIAVSEATRQECLSRGFDAKTTFAVKNGVDHDIAEDPVDPNFTEILKSKYNVDLKGKKVIMTMGRPVKRKGFSWFINNVLPKLDDDFLLLMVGPVDKNPSILDKILLNLPGSFGHKIQLMFGIKSDTPDVVKAIDNNPKVAHLGKLPFKELLQALSLSNVFVMPNISVKGDAEGFGLVALEASMRETVILASGIEGITDAVIDGGNGVLVESENPEAWVKNLNQLFVDEKETQKLAKRGKQFTLDNYSWEKMNAGYAEVFKKFI